MPSVIFIYFLEVHAFSGAIFTFTYIVFDRLVIDLGFYIVIEGIVTADGGVIYGTILIAVVDVFIFVSDTDVALFAALGACFLILFNDRFILLFLLRPR